MRSRIAGRLTAAGLHVLHSPLSLVEQLALLMRDAGIPEPVREYRFHPDRRWRFDFAWPDTLVAAEVEGGVWTRGRHVRPVGFLLDCQKYNAAAAMGWRVFRYPRDLVLSGAAVAELAGVLTGQFSAMSG